MATEDTPPPHRLELPKATRPRIPVHRSHLPSLTSLKPLIPLSHPGHRHNQGSRYHRTPLYQQSDTGQGSLGYSTSHLHAVTSTHRGQLSPHAYSGEPGVPSGSLTYATYSPATPYYQPGTNIDTFDASAVAYYSNADPETGSHTPLPYSGTSYTSGQGYSHHSSAHASSSSRRHDR